MSKTYNYQPAGTFDVATTGNIDDLDFQSCAVIRMTNASLATIRGLKAGYPGQEVSIVSIGAGQVNISHQDGGSAAANKIICFVTSGVTPMAAGVGTATLKYDETTSRWRLISHDQGAPITVTFAAGDFTANGLMTWTVDSGDILVDTYYVVGRVLFLQFGYNATTVGGTANNELRKTYPNGYTVSGRGTCFIRQSQDGNLSFTLSFGLTQVSVNTVLSFFTSVLQLNWSLTTNQTLIEGSAFLNIN